MDLSSKLSLRLEKKKKNTYKRPMHSKKKEKVIKKHPSVSKSENNLLSIRKRVEAMVHPRYKTFLLGLSQRAQEVIRHFLSLENGFQHNTLL